MKKILIMTNFYIPKPLANGICTHQIALSLRDLGNEIHVVCFNNNDDLIEENYRNIHIHRVKAGLFYKILSYAEKNINRPVGKLLYKTAMLTNKIKRIVLLPMYPVTSLSLVFRYYKRARLLHKRNNFDAIISVYNPIESVITGLLIKLEFYDIKLILYVLDSFSNKIKSKYFSKSWLDKKGWAWEKRLYKRSDLILNMESHKNHHSQERYNKFKDKMEFVDLPLLRPLPMDLKKVKDEKIILMRFVYTGALSQDFRNPRYLLDFFTILSTKYNNYQLHFYSRGDCEVIIKKHSKLNSNIIRHGYVAVNESIKAIANADILVSIGNKRSEMTPSKIFEYMSTGKKIIHFYSDYNDSALFYLNKYPNSVLINENDKVNDNLMKIERFIINPQRNLVFKEVEKEFMENTPQFTTFFIERVLHD